MAAGGSWPTLAVSNFPGGTQDDVCASNGMTIYNDYRHMETARISKANFKARALEIFRRVQETGEPVLITDRGRPVLRLEPYYGEDDDAVLASLRGTVLAYQKPTEPVGENAWEALD